MPKVTIVLEFEDHYEGQVLHSGDLESCKRLCENIHAIACSKVPPPKGAGLTMVPDHFPVEVGEKWHQLKEETKHVPSQN